MSETLRDRIKRHEGLVLHPKPDAKGMWEIGYGHDITEQEAHNYPNGCTVQDAENWLTVDIEKATHQVISSLPWATNLTQLRQEVLIEMCYQMGIHSLLGFHHTLQYCQAGDYEATAHGMLGSEWHSQTPERCEELAAIMLNNTN